MALIFSTALVAHGEIIAPTNRMNWEPGVTVGVTGGIPQRTGTVIDVTQSPYFADNTGATPTGAAVQAALDTASTNDIVFAPAGTYIITNGVYLNTHGVTLKGAGISNTVFIGSIVVGHSSSGAEAFDIESGATRGSTSIVVPDYTNAFGATIEAGDAFEITQIDEWTEEFPIIALNGAIRTMGQVVHVQSRSGSTITLTTPLIKDFTNAGQIKSLNLTGNSSARFKEGVGLEDFTLLGTNSAGIGTPATALITLNSLRNFWAKRLQVESPNNYCISVSTCLNGQIEECTIGRNLVAGNSRSGITAYRTTGLLIQNNIFHTLGVGFQAQGGGYSGNVMFANYFHTNLTSKPMLLHNTHPFYNLWEANVAAYIFPDGYFGSASHDTVFRNRFTSTVGPRKNVTYWQIVGNVLGDTNAEGGLMTYEQTASGNIIPYSIFNFGFPHIGNNDYEGTAPPMAGNFPGHYATSASGGGGRYTNGVFTFVGNHGPTNTIWLSMGTGTLTNIPEPIAENYPLKFQDAANTNKYWPDDGTVVLSVSAGTESNLVLNTTMSFSDGWTLYIAGPQAYNHRNAHNAATHNLHGNLVYTNESGTLVWDAENADRTLPASLLYDSAPTWWGTNRWPAIDPESATPTTPIPAQLRYLGIGSEAAESASHSRIGQAKATLLKIGL